MRSHRRKFVQRFHRRILGIAGIALLFAGAGVASVPRQAGAAAVQKHHVAAKQKVVKIMITTAGSRFSFGKPVHIKVGTKVVWINKTPAPHTITSKKPKLFNKSIASGAKVSIIFKKPGTYHYYCAIHPYMKGTIIVKK